jgi:Pentapeptide repeats (8 copies)/Pentapeptide repeats (9 copies)
MKRFLSKIIISKKAKATILIGVLTLVFTLVLSYQWYRQRQTIGMLEQNIQALPPSVSPGKKIELEKDSITLENNAFSTLVQTVGSLLLFATAYVSFQSLKATQKNVDIAEEKQVTERFTQAINQIGSEKIEVRLGGIYSLERIAKDSPKDHWTIMEVLSSFIKERSPIPAEASSSPITTDVQAATKVIARRIYQNESPSQHIDLSKTNLTGASFSGTNLNNANFIEATLIEANFIQAKLKHAFLSRANLNNANLLEANLNNASLSNANLSSAQLIGANLCGASLIGADLSGAILARANLREAYLNGANLSGANLSETDLRGADLSEIKELSDAQLESAKLCRTSLPEGCSLDPNRDC